MMIPGVSMHILIIRPMNGADLITSFFLKCPGTTIPYTGNPIRAGYLDLKDGKLHKIRIELKDAYGNISNLDFKVRYQPEEMAKSLLPGKIFYPGMLDGYEAPDAAFYLGA